MLQRAARQYSSGRFGSVLASGTTCVSNLEGGQRSRGAKAATQSRNFLDVLSRDFWYPVTRHEGCSLW